MKYDMIQANVEEEMKAIMTRFMNNLNHNIAHIMDLHHYIKLKEMVYMVVKVEKQLK
jgi:predicted glycoside hydrolase/deacetylase ChbG (UPF0249 family)